MRGLITSSITLQDIQKQAGICSETLLVLFEIYLKLLNVNLQQIKTI